MDVSFLWVIPSPYEIQIMSSMYLLKISVCLNMGEIFWIIRWTAMLARKTELFSPVMIPDFCLY